jgi:hypothetical protein
MEFLSPLSPVFVVADLDNGALIWVDPAEPAPEDGFLAAVVAVATGLPLAGTAGSFPPLEGLQGRKEWPNVIQLFELTQL